MSFIPLKINGKQLCEIFTPTEVQSLSDEQKQEYSLEHCMYPTEVVLTSETYSRNANRTADYELGDFEIINRKAKPEFVWDIIKHEYVQKLLTFLNYTYEFKNSEGVVIPKSADSFQVEYLDFIGVRLIKAYLGQTIEGTFEVNNDVLYVRNFRIAFPER